jgi:hypothetical protein
MLPLCCSRWFKSCFSETASPPLPASITAYMDSMTRRIEEELALQPGSEAFNILVSGGPPDD